MKVLCLLLALDLSVFASENRMTNVYRPRNDTAVEHYNRGVVLIRKGKNEDARECFDAAIQADPKMWPAYHDRACMWLAQHKYQLAVNDFGAALRIKPGSVTSAILRTSANFRLENYEASVAELEHVLGIFPSLYETWMALTQRAWIRAICADPAFRNGQQAVADAKRACQLSHWKEASPIEALAAAVAETGDFDSAIRYESQAIEVRSLFACEIQVQNGLSAGSAAGR